MTFEYTGRHVDVTPAIREHVEDQFKKLEHLFDGNGAHAHVILAVEKNRHTGELIVHWREQTPTAQDNKGDKEIDLSPADRKNKKEATQIKNKNIEPKQNPKKK